MRLLVLANLSLVALLSCSHALAQSSRSYSLDPRECVAKLQWNIDFTRAKCKVRNGPLSDGQGSQSINFDFPVVEGWPRMEVGIYPLRNGYVVRLKAKEPVSPDQIGPLLTFVLGVAAPQGIARPEGLCAHFLSEVRGLF
ncbi:MAG: hypothetical protein IPJ71_15460 [Bdellovibrionales bacterium]|nr:hypothetical protein [Bdellovibrionales bacterium]